MIKHITLILLTTLFAIYNSCLMAANVAGTVELAEGKVWIQGVDNKMRAIKPEQPIYEGDIIITGADGELQVRMKDDAFIAVRPNSKLKIENYRAEGDADDKATFSLLLGTFRSITGWIGKYNRDNYSINTRTATIGVRGTDHEPMYIPPAVPGMPPIGHPGVYDKVNSGRIVIKNAFGETEFDKGQVAFVDLNSRQAAIRLKGMPDFFKPSQHEQRIEDARTKLQPGIDTNLLKRQQMKKEGGANPRPLLRPQALPEKDLIPETKPVAPAENTDSKLLPGKRPAAPTHGDERSMPVAPQLMPGSMPIQPLQAPARIAPISPTHETPTKLMPAITPPQGILQPQAITPMTASKIEPPSLTAPAATLAPTTTLPSIAPAQLNTQLTPVPVISEQKLVTPDAQIKTAPALISPTLLQSPTQLLQPAR